MNFPDNICAIGGAGKEIAFTILESPWVIDELLKPQPDPVSLTVRILDTAEGEENEDQQRISDLERRIKERKQEYRDQQIGPNEFVGDVEIKYKILTEGVYLGSAIDLISEDKVYNIANGNGMAEENWWLSENNIDETLNFARGVVRQRGLGKGVYYKAYAEDDNISSYIDLPDRGRVAILAGLGGGTGSGILLDLAEDLQERQPTAELTLFGILPNHTEGLKESANAFAALSELEFNALQSNDIFSDRVLIPIDPTKFDGKAGQRIQTADDLQELDEAMVYLLISYYNTTQANMEDPFAGNPDYAPFTIGIPQVLRYNVDAVNEAKEEVESALQSKENALRAEERVYDEVGSFLDRHYKPPEAESARLRENDTTKLTKRLETIESSLDYELFQELDYTSVQTFAEIISDARTQGDAIGEQITIIDSSMRAVDTSSDTRSFVDGTDEELARILEQELQLLKRRMEILKQRNVINDSTIQKTVEYLIEASDTNAAAGVKLQRLESRLEANKEDKESVQSSLDDTKADLEERRNEQASKVERKTSQWLRDADDDLTQLQQLDIGAVRDATSALEQNLAEFRRQVTNAEFVDEINDVQQQPVVSSLQSLQVALEPLDQNQTDLEQNIRDSLEEFKEARMAYIRMQQDDGGLISSLPIIGDNEEEKNEAIKDFRYSRSQLNNKGIYQIAQPAAGFQSEMEFSADNHLKRAQNEEKRLRNDISSSLGRQVETVPEGIQHDFDQELDKPEPSRDSIEAFVRETFEKNIIRTDDLDHEISEHQEQLARLEDEISIQAKLLDVFQVANTKRETWKNNDNVFYQTLSEQGRGAERTFATTDDEYVYVKNIKPDDIFRATGSKDVADSNLFDSNKERRRVADNLKELVENAQNQQYTGLTRRKLTHGNQRYNGQRVRFAAMSRAVEQLGQEELDFGDSFQMAFDIDEGGRRVNDPISSWKVTSGGRWDIGVSVFITGVFLDNIRKMTQAGGYRDGYKQRKNEVGDDIFIHHSFGLENGYYLLRNTLFNMEAGDDVSFFLQDDADIISKLLTEHYNIVKHGENVKLPSGVDVRPPDD